MTTKQTAEIALYGTTQTGAGYIANHAAGMIGDGAPVAGRSFSEAIWLAVDGLRAAGTTTGKATIYAPGGERMAIVDLAHHVPAFGSLTWQPAPQFEVTMWL